MNLNEYTVQGDPTHLVAVWDAFVAEVGRDALFLSIVTERPDGITILDACPTEADFQGWIDGDDWRRVKADLGGDVVVTRLGELRRAVARSGLVDVTSLPARA